MNAPAQQVHIVFRIIAPFAAAAVGLLIAWLLQATMPVILPPKPEPGEELSIVVTSLSLYLVGAAGVLAFVIATISMYVPEPRPWPAFWLQGVNLVAAFLAGIAGLVVIPAIQSWIFG